MLQGASEPQMLRSETERVFDLDTHGKSCKIPKLQVNINTWTYTVNTSPLHSVIHIAL